MAKVGRYGLHCICRLDCQNSQYLLFYLSYSALTFQAADIADIQFLKGTLEMEHPNKFINSFSGVITLEGKRFFLCCYAAAIPNLLLLTLVFFHCSTGMDPEPIGPHNVLLRGCVLRNTDWIIGCVVNTGHHTKILMSASVTPNKVLSFLYLLT